MFAESMYVFLGALELELEVGNTELEIITYLQLNAPIILTNKPSAESSDESSMLLHLTASAKRRDESWQHIFSVRNIKV